MFVFRGLRFADQKRGLVGVNDLQIAYHLVAGRLGLVPELGGGKWGKGKTGGCKCKVFGSNTLKFCIMFLF